MTRLFTHFFSVAALTILSFCCWAGKSLPGILPTQTPSAAQSSTSQSTIVYDAVETITIQNNGPGTVTQIDLKVAMLRTIPPYQEVLRTQVEPLDYQTISDEHGNVYASFFFTNLNPGDSVEVKASYQIKVNEVSYEVNSCQGVLPSEYTTAETYIESDTAEILRTASSVTQQQTDRCVQARDYYNYVIRNMRYTQYNPNDTGALAALRSLRGDCTEFSDLLIALSRAGGIPARMIDGLTCCTENGYNEGQNKHNWVEMYLPGTGWVPMDPTWGRVPGKTERYFGAMSADHIVVTQGRNLDTLNGYHYWAYYYWWDSGQPKLDARENWSILKSQ